MYGSRYMGYNYSPLSSLDETMKKSSGVATNSIKQARTDTLSNLNTSSSSAISASSSSIPSSQSSQRIKNNSQATSTSSSTPHALLTFKNNLFGELTRAIQLVWIKKNKFKFFCRCNMRVLFFIIIIGSKNLFG